jgi:integral membrane sensor domain MASE1
VSRNRRDDVLPRLVGGLAILGVGIIFLLDRAGTINAADYLQWWPLAAVAMGLAHLPHRKWAGGVVWLVIGTYFLLPLLGMTHLGLWRIMGLWPLLISVAGATLVMQAVRRAERPASLRATAVMAGNVQKIGPHFTGGEAVAVMGGCEIDLTAARITGEAVLDVLAFWGGIDIRVPRGWKVVDNVMAILGGVSNKTESPPDGAPRLVIRGSAIMGGVEVKNPPEGAA